MKVDPMLSISPRLSQEALQSPGMTDGTRFAKFVFESLDNGKPWSFYLSARGHHMVCLICICASHHIGAYAVDTDSDGRSSRSNSTTSHSSTSSSYSSGYSSSSDESSHSSDPDFPDPEPASGQRGRPGYERARATVQGQQNYQRSASGNHWEFDSAVNPGVTNRLRDDETDPTYSERNHPNRRRRPALDHHPVQFVALQEHYNARTRTERRRAESGRERVSSPELYNAFSDAVADPSNMRLVMHNEHTAAGQSHTRDALPEAQRRGAQQLFDHHLDNQTAATPGDIDAFNRNRPAPALPRDSGVEEEVEPSSIMASIAARRAARDGAAAATAAPRGRHPGTRLAGQRRSRSSSVSSSSDSSVDSDG